MKEFFRILKFAKPYWLYGLANIFFNILTVVFSLVSLTMVIPFLGLLFWNAGKKVYEAPELALNTQSITQNFYHQITLIIDQKGEVEALFFICILVLVSFFFRNLFRSLPFIFISYT